MLRRPPFQGTSGKDLVSGTTGITAAADTIILLGPGAFAERGCSGHLRTGPGGSETGAGIRQRDRNLGVKGQAEEVSLTPERQQLVELLKKVNSPMQLKEIAKAIWKNKSNVANLLGTLMDLGIMEKAGYGKYQLRSELNESGVSGESGEKPLKGERL